MVTRKPLILGASLVAGLLSGLVAHEAAAAEELVVYGTQAAVPTHVVRTLIRADIESYIAAVRASLDRELKSMLEPAIQVAGETDRARG
jgi:hypothetical protein